MKLAKFLPAKLLAAMLLSVGASGCTTLTQPISGIPANRLPPQFFAEVKNSLVPIDFSVLGQEQPRQYLLDKGDVLGTTSIACCRSRSRFGTCVAARKLSV